ncbi:MAG: cupin domain-containing protein [bacterium]
MNREQIEQLCVGYVLGTLGEKERDLVEKHLKDEAFQEVLSQFGSVASDLLFEAEPVAPRPELKKSILERVQAEAQKEGERDTSSVEENPFYFLKADEGTWNEVSEGVTTKNLFEDTERKITTMLVRMAADSKFAAHAHGGPEELYILEGDCLCAGELLGPGDYHRAESGSEHGMTSTKNGCLMLVISPELTFHA